MQPTFAQAPQYKTIHCPNCATPIPKISFISKKESTQCPTCLVTFYLGDQTTASRLETAIHPMSRHIKLEVTDNNLTLSYSRLALHAKQIGALFLGGALFLLCPLCVVANGEIGWWLWFFPPAWIAPLLIGYAATELINRTIIDVTPTQITVKKRPLPTWFDKVISLDHIEQIYVQESLNRKTKEKLGSYELRLKQVGESEDKILLYQINNISQAFLFEQELERFLGITNKPVQGEPIVKEPLENLSGWEQFAKENNLNSLRGKTLETSRVWGTYQDANLVLIAFYTKDGENRLASRLTLTAKKPLKPMGNVTLPQVQTAFDQIEEHAVSGLAINLNFDRGQIYWVQRDLLFQQPNLTYTIETLHQFMMMGPDIVALGGELMPTLTQAAALNLHPLRRYAWTMMTQIAPMTMRLQDQMDQLFCQRCITACTQHTAKASEIKRVAYFGCRICHQSNGFYEVSQVIARLDSDFGAEPHQDNETLRVNWLTHRKLFDFSAVEIAKASDEDVERFAVEIGNDTDPLRKPHYATMTCKVSADLDPSTLRILERTFGEVIIMNDDDFTTSNSQFTINN